MRDATAGKPEVSRMPDPVSSHTAAEHRWAVSSLKGQPSQAAGHSRDHPPEFETVRSNQCSHHQHHSGQSVRVRWVLCNLQPATRRAALPVVALIMTMPLAACSGDDDGAARAAGQRPNSSSATSIAHPSTTTTASTPAATIEQVRNVIRGTVAHPYPESRDALVAVRTANESLEIETDLGNDADSASEGLAICNAVAAYIGAPAIVIVGTEGRVATGGAGQTPFCTLA